MYLDIVNKLCELKKTIATMESCTGGYVASEITNIPGASEILKFSAVTYSNEYKIRMGVSKEIIDKYSVYSMETARDMALKIATFASADYGVGITGKINTGDPANLMGDDDQVFVAIYIASSDAYQEISIRVPHDKGRAEVKSLIAKEIALKLNDILNNAK